MTLKIIEQTAIIKIDRDIPASLCVAMERQHRLHRCQPALYRQLPEPVERGFRVGIFGGRRERFMRMEVSPSTQSNMAA